MLINPESDRDAFHRGLGCASKASGPTRSVTLSWAREQGLEACGNCAPDLAREVVTDGGRVVESPADGVDDLAFEYVHDPHDPEAFLVRCTTCGEIDECSDRGDAHSKADTHGLNCSATGVTPVSSKRVATDGGRDLYACETPGCDGEKEVVTPDGYVCQSCADALAEQYESDEHDPRLLTDGGQSGNAYSENADPLDLRNYQNPAVVTSKSPEESFEKTSVVHANERDSGTLRIIEFDGTTRLLPAWRWCDVRFLETERVNDGRRRVTPDEWYLLPFQVEHRADRIPEEVEA
ncbi:hypothetical protein [Halostella litorea]|uniref:hypothetical protein n=1 Tax=Halostella litorea TaxID=2528831 RepID=UPI001386929E|nr:hypothetical protein [Halostella litorea]